jgi:DNA-binding response OmpR family regulator
LATILIAEDDKAVREFVSRALTQDGHEVTAMGYKPLRRSKKSHMT